MRTSHDASSLAFDEADDTLPQWTSPVWDLELSDTGGSFNASESTRRALGIDRWFITTNGVNLASAIALDRMGAMVGCVALRQPDSSAGMSVTLSLAGFVRSGVFVSNERDEIVENTLREMGDAAVAFMDALCDDIRDFLRAHPTPHVLRHGSLPIAKKLLVIRCSKTLARCAAAVAIST